MSDRPNSLRPGAGKGEWVDLGPVIDAESYPIAQTLRVLTGIDPPSDVEVER